MKPKNASDTDRLRRFRREAQVLAALSHPNILALHDADWSDGTAYAIFELLGQKPALDSDDLELFNLLRTHAGMALYCTRLHEEVSGG